MIYYSSSETISLDYLNYSFKLKYDITTSGNEVTNLQVYYIRINDSPEDATPLLNAETLSALEKFLVEYHTGEEEVSE